MTETCCEESRMAKLSKSLLLNSELGDLLEAYQKKTGANFTRAVTAAIVQFLFDSPEGPDQLWMQYAVGIENGEIDVGKMPEQRTYDVTAEAKGTVRRPPTRVLIGQIPIPKDFRDRYNQWKEFEGADGDSDIEKILNRWAELQRR